MTFLEDLILHCTAIKGMDRYVLLGWVSQIEEGSDTANASKITVSEWLGVSEDTVKRRTHNLIKDGIMVATGESKFWKPGCETPVYRINVQKIVDLTEGGAICTPTAKCTGVQIAPQGSRFSFGLDLDSSSKTHSTELRSVGKSAACKSKSKRKPETKTNTKVKTCKRCGDTLLRNVNHTCKATPRDSVPNPDRGLSVPCTPEQSISPAVNPPESAPPPAGPCRFCWKPEAECECEIVTCQDCREEMLIDDHHIHLKKFCRKLAEAGRMTLA